MDTYNDTVRALIKKHFFYIDIGLSALQKSLEN